MSPSVDKTQLLAGLVCGGTRKKPTAAMRWWNVNKDGNHACLASSTSANKASTSVCPQLNSIPIIPGNWKAVLKGAEPFRTIDSRILCHHQSTRNNCWPAWCAAAPERNKQPPCVGGMAKKDGNHACLASSTSANKASTSVCPQLNSIPIIPGNWKAVCQGQNPFAPLTQDSLSPSVDKTQLLAGLVCGGTRKKQTAAMRWWKVKKDGNHACLASSTSANKASTSVCPQLNSIPIIPGNWKAVCQGRDPFAPLTQGFFVTISRQDTTAGRLGVRRQKETNSRHALVECQKRMKPMRA